jgi:hypothetical protein
MAKPRVPSLAVAKKEVQKIANDCAPRFCALVLLLALTHRGGRLHLLERRALDPNLYRGSKSLAALVRP